MSTKRGRVRCPKCYRRMSVPSQHEWRGIDQQWHTVCLICVREHFADPLLHLRANKMSRLREKV